MGSAKEKYGLNFSSFYVAKKCSASLINFQKLKIQKHLPVLYVAGGASPGLQAGMDSAIG